MSDVVTPARGADAFVHLEVPRDAPMRTVLHAGDTFLSVVMEVGREVTEHRGGPIRWLLAQATTTDVINLRLRGVVDRDVSLSRLPAIGTAVATGFQTLEAEARRPEYFTDQALERASEFAEFVPDLGSLRVVNGSVATNVTVESATHVRQLLGTSYTAYGSVDGTIEGINLHDRRQFIVYDSFTGKRIKCEFGDRIGVDEVANALAGQRRVNVYGTINYRSDDEIASVLADDLYIFPPTTELPTADDVRGILG